MVDVLRKKCTHRGCTKRTYFGAAGSKVAEFCSGHAKDGMVDVLRKKCTHHGCTTVPSYGAVGSTVAEFCSGHAKDEMVDVRSKKCTHHGCTKRPSYGAVGSKVAEFCSGHAKDGMVDVRSKKCTHHGCTKGPSFGVAGTKMTEFCSGHAKDWMVNVRSNKKGTHCDSTKKPSDGVGCSTRTFCAQLPEGVVRVSASKVTPGVHRSKSGARECGGVGLDGGTVRRSGAGDGGCGCGGAGAGAGGKRKDRPPSSTQVATSAGRSEADSKRARQAPCQTSVTPVKIETSVEDSRKPVGDGSCSEPQDAAVKTEAAVSVKADLTVALPVEAVTGEMATPVEDGRCAGPDGAVKAEVGISFPSRNAAAEGRLNRRGARGERERREGSAAEHL
ncbi:unnamed protein product [Pylaiella littoralis]